jgi:hypothetical protein
LEDNTFIELTPGTLVRVTIGKQPEKGKDGEKERKKDDRFLFKVVKSPGRVNVKSLLDDLSAVLVRALRKLSPSSVKFNLLELYTSSPSEVARKVVSKKTSYGLLQVDNAMDEIKYSKEPYELSLSSSEAVQSRREGSLLIFFISAQCARYSSASPDGDGDSFKSFSASHKAMEAFVKLLRNKIVLPKTGYELILYKEIGRSNSADRFVPVLDISPQGFVEK